MASASGSASLLTTRGEKMSSMPRTMWRSMTWVVMFAMKAFWETCVGVMEGLVCLEDWEGRGIDLIDGEETVEGFFAGVLFHIWINPLGISPNNLIDINTC